MAVSRSGGASVLGPVLLAQSPVRDPLYAHAAHTWGPRDLYIVVIPELVQFFAHRILGDLDPSILQELVYGGHL